MKNKKLLKPIISNHAWERLEERIGGEKHKLSKMVNKAWASPGDNLKQDLINTIKRSNFLTGTEIFKYFLGYIFVFKPEFHHTLKKKIILLITVYNPKAWNKNHIKSHKNKDF